MVVRASSLPPRLFTLADGQRDGVTDDQKPIITRHPNHPNLIVAGGASYTHAKDLPTIGLTVSDTVNGKESHASYGWAASSPHKDLDNQSALRTTLEFRDLELEATKDKRVQDWKKTRPDWIT